MSNRLSAHNLAKQANKTANGAMEAATRNALIMNGLVNLVESHSLMKIEKPVWSKEFLGIKGFFTYPFQIRKYRRKIEIRNYFIDVVVKFREKHESKNKSK